MLYIQHAGLVRETLGVAPTFELRIKTLHKLTLPTEMGRNYVAYADE